MLIRLLPCVCNLVLGSLSLVSVSLVHCNTSLGVLSLISVEFLFRVVLPPFISIMCVSVGLVIRSALGLICGVLRLPYLQLHHIFLVSCVIALIPLVFTSSHPCTSLILLLGAHYYSPWNGKITFSCQFLSEL
jgi:hypothetical protein